MAPNIYMVGTYPLQVERGTRKVRQPQADVLPLCIATNIDTLLYQSMYKRKAGMSIPMGQGDMSPTIYEWGDVHGNVPPNILEVMSFRMSTRVTTRNYVQIPKESG